MVKVRTLISFKDIKEKKIREKGEEFEVSKERYDEINNCDYCKENNNKLIEIIEEISNEEITEEEVQAVAGAIVETAEEENKSVEEVVNEIIEEEKGQMEQPKELTSEIVEDKEGNTQKKSQKKK